MYLKSWKRELLYIFCFISYTCTYLVRVNLSMAAPGLREAGLLTSGQIGVMGGVFSAMYAFGRIFNGRLCDRIPPRYMMVIGLGLGGLCNLCIGLFPPYAGMLILWGINAFALSMLWGAIQSVNFVLYDGEKGRVRMSILSSAVAMGNIVSILLTSWLVGRFSTAMAFIVPGALVMTVGIFDCFLYRRVGLYYGGDKPEVGNGTASLPIMALLKRTNVRRAAMAAVFHGIMKECISLWMALVFVDIYGLNLEKYGLFIVLIPVIGFIGRILFPVCYRLLGGDEMKTGRYAFVICAVCGVLLCFKSMGVMVALLAISLMYAGVSMINTGLLSIYPSRFTAEHSMNTLAGIMDTSTYTGGAIFSVIFGYVVGKWGYVPMFACWAAISVAGMLALPKVEK